MYFLLSQCLVSLFSFFGRGSLLFTHRCSPVQLELVVVLSHRVRVNLRTKAIKTRLKVFGIDRFQWKLSNWATLVRVNRASLDFLIYVFLTYNRKFSCGALPCLRWTLFVCLVNASKYHSWRLLWFKSRFPTSRVCFVLPFSSLMVSFFFNFLILIIFYLLHYRGSFLILSKENRAATLILEG